MRDLLQVEGMKITVEDIIGSTGLELKVDPGVPWVYAGFAGTPASAALHTCLILTSHELNVPSSIHHSPAPPCIHKKPSVFNRSVGLFKAQLLACHRVYCHRMSALYGNRPDTMQA